jgi:hypothetical protein
VHVNVSGRSVEFVEPRDSSVDVCLIEKFAAVDPLAFEREKHVAIVSRAIQHAVKVE